MSHPNLRNSLSGFSLLEMAVVLMILGTLMSGMLVAVSQTSENGRRTSAMAQMREIEEALMGYAQINGRLPCPATVNGFEVTDGGTGCNRWYGFVPAATLGLSGSTSAAGLLLDPWQNPYRYAVAQFTNGGNFVFTNYPALQAFYGNPVTNDDNNPPGDTDNMLTITCVETRCDPPQLLSDTVPALVLSMGANWANCATASANEVENSCEDVLGVFDLPADNNFVITDYSEDNFDDLVLWLSPYLLFNRMISAGKLP